MSFWTDTARPSRTGTMDKEQFTTSLEHAWKTGTRWRGVTRPYTAGDVYRLRGSIDIEYSLARYGAARLWQLFQDDDYVAVLSAVTGNQAIQQVQAGLKAIYVSGWQVDAEAGFGGPLHAFEIMKNMIDAGAAGVHFEDQLASVKKCGHLGGKVLVPTSEFITKLVAARLATDVCGVDTILIARTDANSATLLTSDCDEYDQRFVTGERTTEGFFQVKNGVEAAIARALAYAPYADLLWFETSKPDIEEARRFAEAVHAKFPRKLLAYNCSPSFNWKKHLTKAQIASFQKDLGAMGYKFQFVTLSAFHALNHSLWLLAKEYKERGMAAYADLQEREFTSERDGYEAIRHQEFVGVGYFDEVTQVATNGKSATLAMEGSTEQEQFRGA